MSIFKCSLYACVLAILVFAHLVESEAHIHTHTRRVFASLNQIAVHFLGDFLFTLFGCLLICSNNIMYTCLGISAYSLIRAAAAVAADDDDGGKHRLSTAFFLFSFECVYYAF